MSDPALPRVSIGDATDVAGALRALQLVVLEHPVAFQAAFAALVEEGRHFATTETGREWRERLEDSSLLHRARLALELGSLWMLEARPTGVLPSGFVDALFLAAESPELESIVDGLFEEMVGDDER
jgi:hypothetical protein